MEERSEGVATRQAHFGRWLSITGHYANHPGTGAAVRSLVMWGFQNNHTVAAAKSGYGFGENRPACFNTESMFQALHSSEIFPALKRKMVIPETLIFLPVAGSPMWKEAWEAAKQRAGVECRFHDLRHTGATHLLEAGATIDDVADIMGWSTSTAIRMVREVYGHKGPASRRATMQKLEQFYTSRSQGAQKGAQPEEQKNVQIQ